MPRPWHASSRLVPRGRGGLESCHGLWAAVLVQLAAVAFWGAALTWHPAIETPLVGAFLAYNVARVHALVAGLTWSEADDRRVLLATAALFLPGLGMAVWWVSRWRDRHGP